MRKKIITISVIMLTAVVLIFIKAASGGFEKKMIPDTKIPGNDWKDVRGPFIRTLWKQDGSYAQFSPGRNLLGCWSVAFAQVLGYHKLQPSGDVTYVTSAGDTISEKLNFPFRWNHVSDSISESGSCTETARYCYYTAIVAQKDFGTGDYSDVSIIPDEIGNHYGCTVQKIEAAIPAMIVSEIAEGRPVVVYFDDILSIKLVTNGHAAVIDGTAALDDKLMVHLNLGWGGDSDGWYEYQSLASERKLKYIFSVHPHNSF